MPRCLPWTDPHLVICSVKEKEARRKARAPRWGPPPPQHLAACVAGELIVNILSSATFKTQRLQQEKVGALVAVWI